MANLFIRRSETHDSRGPKFRRSRLGKAAGDDRHGYVGSMCRRRGPAWSDAPIRKILACNVGQPWLKVQEFLYRKARENVTSRGKRCGRRNGFLPWVLSERMPTLVAMHVDILDAGTVYDQCQHQNLGQGDLVGAFYVHPETGLLCQAFPPGTQDDVADAQGEPENDASSWPVTFWKQEVGLDTPALLLDSEGISNSP